MNFFPFQSPTTHPVIGEVFVDNLPHLGLLCVQDVWGKVEDDVQHAGLGGQGGAAVLRVGEGRDLGGEGGVRVCVCVCVCVTALHTWL